MSYSISEGKNISIVVNYLQIGDEATMNIGVQGYLNLQHSSTHIHTHLRARTLIVKFIWNSANLHLRGQLLGCIEKKMAKNKGQIFYTVVERGFFPARPTYHWLFFKTD